MTFANPEYFNLGIFILLLCLLAFFSMIQGRRAMSRFGNTKTLRNIILRHSTPLRLAQFILTLLSLTFLVLTIARPQHGLVEAEDTSSGIEAVIMVDVSNSMLANDVSPSRLERAKFLLGNLIDEMHGDRVGLGIFAGEAYLQVPITTDRSAVKSILSNLSPSMISSQGTHIAAALQIADRGFSENADADKAIILLTDGENHEGDVESVAGSIASSGRKLYVLGIGTPEGATIPTPNGPLTDGDGSVVVTRLDENLCREVAGMAHGEYIHVDNTLSAQAQLLDSLKKLKRSTDTTRYSTYDERFQLFGIISLLLLVLSLLLPEYFRRRGSRPSAIRMLVLIFITFSTLQPLMAQTPSWRVLHSANRQFDRGNYAEAQSRYEDILEKNPANPRALFNAANAALAQGDADKAVQLYSSATQLEQNPEIKSRAYHNLGVISQTAALKADETTRQQLLREAISHYKNALRNNPSDDAARYNMELCRKQLKDNKQEKDNQDRNKKEQEKKQPAPPPQQPQPDRKQDRSQMAKQQLLNMTRQSEQKTRDKINAAKPQRSPREKNW